MTRTTDSSRPVRLCRTCRRTFDPIRATHAYCGDPCRKLAFRRRQVRPEPGPSEQLLGEVHSMQELAGLTPSPEHPYLTQLAKLRHLERQANLYQQRLAQARRDLAAIAEPAMRVRILHLARPDAALEPIGHLVRWVGIWATQEGAVLVLGSDRQSSAQDGTC